jgi:hypothetical protein
MSKAEPVSQQLGTFTVSRRSRFGGFHNHEHRFESVLRHLPRAERSGSNPRYPGHEPSDAAYGGGFPIRLSHPRLAQGPLN